MDVVSSSTSSSATSRSPSPVRRLPPAGTTTSSNSRRSSPLTVVNLVSSDDSNPLPALLPLHRAFKNINQFPSISQSKMKSPKNVPMPALDPLPSTSSSMLSPDSRPFSRSRASSSSSAARSLTSPSTHESSRRSTRIQILQSPPLRFLERAKTSSGVASVHEYLRSFTPRRRTESQSSAVEEAEGEAVCAVEGCDSSGHLGGRLERHFTREACPTFHRRTAQECRDSAVQGPPTKKKGGKPQAYCKREGIVVTISDDEDKEPKGKGAKYKKKSKKSLPVEKPIVFMNPTVRLLRDIDLNNLSIKLFEFAKYNEGKQPEYTKTNGSIILEENVPSKSVQNKTKKNKEGKPILYADTVQYDDKTRKRGGNPVYADKNGNTLKKKLACLAPPITGGPTGAKGGKPSAIQLRARMLNRDLREPILSGVAPERDLAMFRAAQAAASETIESERAGAAVSDVIRSVVLGDNEMGVAVERRCPPGFDGPALLLCEFCLAHVKSQATRRRHESKCVWRHPPGDEVYRKDALSVWQVDGRQQVRYSQNLCFLGMLFIKTKSVHLKVKSFCFYVMTRADDAGCHLVGYFSKDHAWPQCNLSCLLVLPAYQRRGYGQLLVEFSYLLSRMEGTTGVPEKPLSDQGFICYRLYWTEKVLEQLSLAGDHSVSISEMSKMTGIDQDDVVSTLQALGLIKYWRGQHIILRHQDLIEGFLERAQCRPGIDATRVMLPTPSAARTSL